MTLEEIVNSLKSAGQDYGQLLNNNPKYTAVAWELFNQLPFFINV
jgi:hypothetical protein